MSGRKPGAESEGFDAVVRRAATTVAARGLADAESPVLLMVSGGSDSTALAYVAAALSAAGNIGPVAVLHVNHLLRGEDAAADARFVERVAAAIGAPCEVRAVDVGAIARAEGSNVEAVGRRERYRAATEALNRLCREAGAPAGCGRVFTAHTRDDRVEGFYMRSIVGTGPGGLRSMGFANGRVVRPLLETARSELRAAIEARAAAGLPTARDAAGALWREDATNDRTDRFRAFVRAEIVPRARERNPRLLETLCRTMDLVADEDDFMEGLAAQAAEAHVAWEAAEGAPGAVEGESDAACGFCGAAEGVPAASGAPAAAAEGVPAAAGAPAAEGPPAAPAAAEGAPAAPAAAEGAPAAPAPAAPAAAAEACVLSPGLGAVALPVRRRVVAGALRRLLGSAARIESAAVEAVLAAYASDGCPIGGYVANVQGDLAVSANKRGVRIEPMAAFRRRRKKGRL